MKNCPACAALCFDSARFCPSCGANVESVRVRDTDPYQGTVLAGKYRVQTLIGEGGMARVYRAVQVGLDKPVAVKILHQHLIGNEQSVKRFKAEAKEASRLNHPNIVSVMEFGETPFGVLFMVMEYLRGRHLGDIITEEWPLTMERVMAIFRQVLLAVGEAHHQSVLHRDLKPDNIFVERLADGSERVKVLDFGIAKRFDQDDGGLTAPGMVCGTPEYMSPEQVVGDPLDPRSDVYALGILLYEMLTGAPPFLGGTASDVMVQHTEREPLPPSEAFDEQGHSIPQSLDAIVLWALAKDRHQRIKDAEAFRRVLDSWMLVSSTRAEGDEEAVAASACPSCGALNWEDSDVCPVCGYWLPANLPMEGTQFLIDSLGEEEVQRLQNAGPAVRATAVRGLGQAPGPVTSEEETLSPENMVRELPLVGRREELARLERELESSGVVQLLGEPGAGKSRLVEEIAARAGQAGKRVVCLSPRDDADCPSPLWVLRQLVSTLLEEPLATLRPKSTLRKAASRLDISAEALPGLSALLAPSDIPLAWADLRARERELVAALEDLLHAASADQPLALLIDDLEQLDAPSQRILRSLLSRKLPATLWLLLSSTQVDSALETVPRLTLAPLNRKDSLELAEAKQVGQPLHSEAMALLDLTGGNPFFVEQLVRLIHEGGLPGRLARRIELLDARLDRLPLHLRRRLQRIAVHRGRVPIERLRLAFPDDTKQMPREIDDLARLGLLIVDEQWIAASHELLEDAVLAGMPAEIRRQAHRRYLETMPAGLHAAYATVRHASGGADEQTTVEQLERGAGVALTHYDDARAEEWLREAMQRSRLLWNRGEPSVGVATQQTVELGRRLAEVLALRGEHAVSEQVLGEVLRYVNFDQPALEAAVLLDLAHLTRERGAFSDASEYIEQAQQRCDKAGALAGWLRAELAIEQGLLANRSGQRDVAISSLECVLELSDESRERGDDQACRAQLALGDIYLRSGDAPAAQRHLQEALTIAARAELSACALDAHQRLAMLSSRADNKGGDEVAGAHLMEAVKIAQELGDRARAARLVLRLGEWHADAGRLPEAINQGRRAQRLAKAVDLSHVQREAHRFLQRIEGPGTPLPS